MNFTFNPNTTPKTPPPGTNPFAPAPESSAADSATRSMRRKSIGIILVCAAVVALVAAYTALAGEATNIALKAERSPFSSSSSLSSRLETDNGSGNDQGQGDQGQGVASDGHTIPADTAGYTITDTEDEGAADARNTDGTQIDGNQRPAPGSLGGSDDLYNRYGSDPSRRPSPAEMAAVATERGILLNRWEIGFDEQNQHMLKSYGIYNPGDYPDNRWLTWNKPTIGMTLLFYNPETDKARKCTLAGFTRSQDASAYYGVTAGHCARDGFTQVSYKRSNEPRLRPFGEVARWQRMGKPGPNDPYSYATDIAYVRLTDEVVSTMVPKIAGKLDITGIITPDQITPGTRVCKLGYRTQESCGSILASNGSLVRAHLFSLSGDSGSLLYVRNDDNTASVIGVLSGSPRINLDTTHDFLTDFALLAPPLQQDGQIYINRI